MQEETITIITPDGPYVCEDWKERNHLTRQGENLCPICNRPKEMYYEPWCPRCEKPMLHAELTLNLMQALRHMEAIGHQGVKDRLWDWIVIGDDTEKPLRRNDSTFYLEFPPPEEKTMYEDEYTLQQLADLDLMKEIFGIEGRTVLVHLSW